MKDKKRKSHSFRYSILVQIIPWVCAILILTTVLVVYHSFRTLKSQTENSTEIIVSQKADEFERYFADIKSTLAYVASEPEVKSILQNYERMDAIERYRAKSAIDGMLSNLNIFKNYLEDVFIIGENGYYANLLSYSELKANCSPLEWESIRQYHPGDHTFFFYTTPLEADYYVAEPHKVYCVVLPVYSNKKLIGYVQGNLNYQSILAQFQNNSHLGGMEFTVLNQDSQTVFSTCEEDIGKLSQRNYLSHATGEQGSFLYGEKDRELVVYQHSSITGWYFIASVSYRNLLAPGYAAAKMLLLVVLPAVVLLTVLIIGALSRRIRIPIERLMIRVNEVEPECYEPSEIQYGVKEIDLLGRRFEESMERIHTLIQNVYQAELKKKDAEFAALRNQITPHFMNNSLQLIKAESLLSGNREISAIVTALGNLLRYSMDCNTRTVAAGDELAYIRDYLELYKRRYVNKFDYEVNIAPGSEHIPIPKMILQPLVENSIRHGFKDRRTGGMIRVSGSGAGSECCFEIWDNGCGISPERIKELLASFHLEEQDSSSEIGLANVHQRICMQCGADCGIVSIESQEGDYTRLLVRTKMSEERNAT